MLWFDIVGSFNYVCDMICWYVYSILGVILIVWWIFSLKVNLILVMYFFFFVEFWFVLLWGFEVVWLKINWI